MFFDIGGWWLTCDHMFRRFGTPFASDWIAKNVNGYVYHAAVPADPSLAVESSEYQARYAVRVPRGEWADGIGAYLGAVLPHYAENFLDWWGGPWNWRRTSAPTTRREIRSSSLPTAGTSSTLTK